MDSTKTYQSLTELNSASGPQYGKSLRVPVLTCSALLPNKMQCWRSGDVLITTTTPAPTEEKPDAVNVTHAQMCYRHAQVDQKVYEQALANEANAAEQAAALDAKPATATTAKK